MTTPSTTSLAVARAERERRAPGLARVATGRLGIAGCIAAGILLVIALAATFAPIVAPYDPDYPDLLASLSGPSPAHLLGTDALGRDILSRLMPLPGRAPGVCSDEGR